MNRKKLWWLWGALTAGTAGIMLLDALFLEKYFFSVKTFDIGRKGSGRQLRLLLLADLHLKDTMYPYYRKLAGKVNQLKPDLIMLSGDTLDAAGETPLLEEFLRLLQPHVPKVAIPGNNDYKADPHLTEMKKAYKKHGVDFLINASKKYALPGATSLMVTGLDDLLRGDSCFEKAVEGVGHEEHHLLLVHSPLQQEAAQRKMEEINASRSASEQLNIQYIFAGHTHGGQVRLPGYVPVLPAKSGDYVDGWYNDSAPYLYVSKGFGTSTVPFRFDARSELTVFNYHI